VVERETVDVERLRGMSDDEFDTFTASPAPEDDIRPIEFTLDDLDNASPAASPVVRETVEDIPEPVASGHLPPLSFETSGDDFVSETRAQVFESGDADVGIVSDNDGGLDDAATKLELARAYLDMGDPEGARAMLEEVLGEGDAGQRAEARRLLAML
jgi:pilus assembly protein FimV